MKEFGFCEAAAEMHIGQATLRKMIEDGVVAVRREGRRIFVSQSQIEAFKKSHNLPQEETETEGEEKSVRERIQEIFNAHAKEHLEKEQTFTAKVLLNLWDEIDDVLME